MMEEKFDSRIQQRKILKARRPSTKSKFQPNFNDCNTRVVKRKSNEFDNDNKRLKRSDISSVADTHVEKPGCTSPKSTKYSANNRLQNLRKRLIETQQTTRHSYDLDKASSQQKIRNNNTSNIPIKNTNKNTYSNRSIPVSTKSVQNRLKVAARHNLTSNTKNLSRPNLNQTLPSSSRTTSYNDNQKLFDLNKTVPAKLTKQSDVHYSPFTCSTPVKYENKIWEDTRSPRSCDKLTNTFEKRESPSNHATNNNCASNSSEKMDWSPINESLIIENISSVRRELDYREHRVDIPQEVSGEPAADGQLHIVVDTNIFLSDLTLISDLKNKGKEKSSVVVVPWMVMQELDYMKDGRSHPSLVAGARRAVAYINKCLVNKDPGLRGQTVMEAAKQDIQSNNADDGILFCCLQLHRQNKDVLLVSNDVSLRSKALVCGLRAEGARGGEVRAGAVQSALGRVTGRVVADELREAYGDVWPRVAARRPPLGPRAALHLLQRFWQPVFSHRLPKQAKMCIDDFLSFYHKLPDNSENISKDDFQKLVEFSLRLCIYLKNTYSEHRQLVTDTISQITQSASLQLN